MPNIKTHIFRHKNRLDEFFLGNVKTCSIYQKENLFFLYFHPGLIISHFYTLRREFGNLLEDPPLENNSLVGVCVVVAQSYTYSHCKHTMALKSVKLQIIIMASDYPLPTPSKIPATKTRVLIFLLPIGTHTWLCLSFVLSHTPSFNNKEASVHLITPIDFC